MGDTSWPTVKHLTKSDFTGDGIADVTAVWNDGTLHAHPGKGDGTVTPPTPVTLGGATGSTVKHLA
ncbi:FG-GAP-like repeat-containing protein [Streptomyces roseolilacinus]|uniref:FG-GAP-like repeat-containing protein n=1 Tax=Streptomyces roseolilacinus TaxID=66904 RepID=UPI0038034F0D